MRVSGAVPILMMMANDRNYWIRKIDRRKNVGSDAGMQLHLFKFGGSEFARFVQDILRDRQLSHIVKQGGRFNCPYQFFIGNAYSLCETDGICLYPSDMAMRDLILCVDRHGQ